MKKSLLCCLTVAFLIFGSCNNSGENSSESGTDDDAYSYFGEKISGENTISPSELVAQMEGKNNLNVKVKTTIKEVCQKKGCWMDIDLGNSKTMKVRFKDYGFFVPKDAAGKEVVFEGTAFYDTVSVDELKHYAEDGGQPAEEIAKISEPEINLAFEASGVMIKNE